MPEIDAQADALFQQGVALHRQGRLAEAEVSYKDVLRARPDHFDALHNSGIIALRSRDPRRAVALLEQALALQPDHAAFNNHGIALMDLGRTDEALVSFSRAIELNPDDAASYKNRGTALRRMDRPEEAVSDFDKALALNPNDAAVFHRRGKALGILGRFEAAQASFEQAINLDPNDPAAHQDRGIALSLLGRFEDALSSFDRTIALAADVALFHERRGNVLLELGRLEEALASFDRALALAPDVAATHASRGNVLHDLERLGDALSSLDQAVAMDPGYALAHSMRGCALTSLGRFAEALPNFDRAIALDPDSPSGYWNQSLCRLAAGDYEGGWPLFEWRWKLSPQDATQERPAHLWLGDSPIDGKTILVRAEMGLGDTLQFCRYVPMLAAHATVVLEVPRPLVRLLSSLDRAVRVIAIGDDVPPFDVWIPMMSLPLAFRTTLATIPASVPYLRADPERAAAWRHRFASLPGRKIGLVWAGSPRPGQMSASLIDRRRSLAPDQLLPLATVPGLCLISLQKGDVPAPPASLAIHDWTGELDDFADTAALVEALDLVISVDTAAVHLAGALGKPVWVLNRFDQCWRWLWGREDSPWYPSARLFRQSTQGDWAGVIQDVVSALRTGALLGDAERSPGDNE